jgi:DNA polymerase/3'-5' exonuclease PolX
MSMDRRGVALVLEEIATLLEASGGNRFKARAFMKAARIVDKLDAEPADLVASGALRAVPGLGPATAGVIEELVVTGESAYHAELRTRAPSGLRDLLRVPGLGNAKVAQLYAELGIADLDSLEAAARAGRIAGVRGFGEPTQARILAGIPFARGATGRRRYHHALEAAARLASYFGRLPGVAAAHTAGELRRALEIVDSLVFVLEVPGDLDAALAAVRGTPGLIWAGDASSMARGRMATVSPSRCGSRGPKRWVWPRCSPPVLLLTWKPSGRRRLGSVLRWQTTVCFAMAYGSTCPTRQRSIARSVCSTCRRSCVRPATRSRSRSATRCRASSSWRSCAAASTATPHSATGHRALRRWRKARSRSAGATSALRTIPAAPATRAA